MEAQLHSDGDAFKNKWRTDAERKTNRSVSSERLDLKHIYKEIYVKK